MYSSICLSEKWDEATKAKVCSAQRSVVVSSPGQACCWDDGRRRMDLGWRMGGRRKRTLEAFCIKSRASGLAVSPILIPLQRKACLGMHHLHLHLAATNREASVSLGSNPLPASLCLFFHTPTVRIPSVRLLSATQTDSNNVTHT